jgi:hypothetical protein
MARSGLPDHLPTVYGMMEALNASRAETHCVPGPVELSADLPWLFRVGAVPLLLAT